MDVADLRIWPPAHIKLWKKYSFMESINPFVGSELKTSLPNNKTAVSRPSY